MKNMNIFGGQGYLTDEERERTLYHGCEYLTFESCIDLSKPIKISPFGNISELPIELYTRDIMSFMCWWTNNIHKDLNGFSGFHNVKFELVGFKIKS